MYVEVNDQQSLDVLIQLFRSDSHAFNIRLISDDQRRQRPTVTATDLSCS